MRGDDPVSFYRSNSRFRRPVPAFGGVFAQQGAISCLLLFAFVWMISAMLTPSASAHGRLGAAAGRCRLFIGPDIMNVTGYLPDASKSEFCEDIPDTGHMIMTLDAEQEELRAMPVEIRIVRDVDVARSEEADLDNVTVAYRKPKVYPSGTITFEHVFDDPGYFVGIVTATGEHGERWVSRFPFSVGKTFMRTLPYYVLLTLGVFAVFFIYMRYLRRTAAHPQPEPAE